MTEIDGSHGEGGGQLVRMAVAVAAALGVPVRIVNIRARRRVPGLAAQHVAAVRAVAALCDADCEGGGISANVSDPDGSLGEVCSRRQLNIITGVAAAGMGVVTLGAAYMAFRSSGGKGETASLGARKKRGTEVVVTPLVTPDSGGAILWMRW